MAHPGRTRLSRASNARRRYEERQRKRESMAVRLPDNAKTASNSPTPRLATADPRGETWGEIQAALRDGLWYLRHRTPLPKILLGSLVLLLVLSFLGTLFSPQIGPNVWAMGVPLGGLTVEEAEVRLVNHWHNLSIDLVAGDQVIRRVRPAELGLRIDAAQMARQAYNVRLAGFPLGYSIAPELSVDRAVLQNMLIDLVSQVYVPPYEAGYEWQGEQLVAVRGRSSRELDVIMSMARLSDSPLAVVQNRRLELETKATPPNVVDSSPYLEQALSFLKGGFQLVGYDPFIDEEIPWTSTREEITKWLAAGSSGLTLRELAFKPFLDALNARLRQEARPRYLDEREVLEAVSQSIANQQSRAFLRVRYLPQTYTINSGDWGQRISRRTGLPFNLIDKANPGLNWNQLSVGQVINLPSRDALLLEPPVPHKRIVVDLERRYMVAFENGEVVMHWRVSIGRGEAPTHPGIFQILSKTDVAYGSGFSLCNSTGCGQWEMAWFMGIYEIVPGLMNGFHGAVRLPNGAYLDDGRVGNASTYGCVMAGNGEAKRLYDWADKGTVVEILAREFPPESDLARRAVEFMNSLGV
ncbi:MAG: L,D-transpeptidase family protein [Anaerolineae bacterium]|nr:L,D-transpeptidase family protein [Anaerolineae bacterium]